MRAGTHFIETQCIGIGSCSLTSCSENEALKIKSAADMEALKKLTSKLRVTELQSAVQASR